MVGLAPLCSVMSGADVRVIALAASSHAARHHGGRYARVGRPHRPGQPPRGAMSTYAPMARFSNANSHRLQMGA